MPWKVVLMSEIRLAFVHQVDTLPNQLWQCDHKGPLEVGRRKIHPFTVLDDHSRYLLALRPCLDLTMPTAFAVLWDAFGEFGLPESILCDNAFATTFQVPRTVSWFDAQLIRLGIHPLHGRPYHPQTQGKVERIDRPQQMPAALSRRASS